jgi:hypothetical protein
MNCTAKNPDIPLRIGLLLFDEARTRVFALRGTRIEDAREYAVDVQRLKVKRGAELARLRPLGAMRIRERAAHTARLVAALHDECPFDCLLVAGPPWAQLLVLQQLPPHLRSRLVGSLTLSVSAGESAILAAALPVMPTIFRMTRSTLHRTVVAGCQRSRFAGVKQFMAMIGGSMTGRAAQQHRGTAILTALGANNPAWP